MSAKIAAAAGPEPPSRRGAGGEPNAVATRSSRLRTSVRRARMSSDCAERGERWPSCAAGQRPGGVAPSLWARSSLARPCRLDRVGWIGMIGARLDKGVDDQPDGRRCHRTSPPGRVRRDGGKARPSPRPWRDGEARDFTPVRIHHADRVGRPPQQDRECALPPLDALNGSVGSPAVYHCPRPACHPGASACARQDPRRSPHGGSDSVRPAAAHGRSGGDRKGRQPQRQPPSHDGCPKSARAN